MMLSTVSANASVLPDLYMVGYYSEVVEYTEFPEFIEYHGMPKIGYLSSLMSGSTVFEETSILH